MTTTRPAFQPKKLIVASLFSLAIMAGSFLFLAAGKAGIAAIFGLVLCWLGYIFSVLSYRPKTSKWELLPAMALGVLTVFPANMGSHSLWLTAYGETLRCKAISIETHVHRSTANTYSNRLQCGDRELTYYPSMYRYVYEVGAEMKIVVDKTGFVPNLEPAKVGLGHSLLLLLAVVVNGVFLFLVAWLPVRPGAAEPGRPKVGRQLGKDFI